ncbi:MAG: hypothetical protein FWF57_00200 [Defluviitaleaceae bacterium]|nr:hypothetical protein [Defluviitaleaceae bacterium]
MQDFFKKVTAFLLLLAIMLKVIVPVYANDIFSSDVNSNFPVGTTFYYDGFTHEVTSNNSYEIVVTTRSDNYITNVRIDKITRDVTMQVTEVNSDFRRTISDNLEFSISGNTIDGELFDISFLQNENVVYDFTIQEFENPRARAFVVPLWMGLGVGAVRGLIAFGVAVIIGSTAWVAADQLISTMERQNEFRYFAAQAVGGMLMVGPGLNNNNLARNTVIAAHEATVQAEATGRRVPPAGVFAITRSFAKGLAGVDPVIALPHGNVGFFPHYHPQYALRGHIWHP